jgi:preprotein translocase subunit SecG
MATVLLIIHSLLAVALIGVVLLQRSEGGALGMGGGGGGGGFMTGRGTANFLTRATAGLAAAFFATSLILSIMASAPQGQSTILDTKEGATTGQPKSKAPPKSGDSKLPTFKLDADGSADTDPPKTSAPEPPPRVPQSK